MTTPDDITPAMLRERIKLLPDVGGPMVYWMFFGDETQRMHSARGLLVRVDDDKVIVTPPKPFGGRLTIHGDVVVVAVEQWVPPGQWIR